MSIFGDAYKQLSVLGLLFYDLQKSKGTPHITVLGSIFTPTPIAKVDEVKHRNHHIVDEINMKSPSLSFLDGVFQMLESSSPTCLVFFLLGSNHLRLVVWNILFSHILGIIIPTDFHIFQGGSTTNHLHRLSIDYLMYYP